jgi:diadenosine tetraphosphate (Ap4A) HIT family hydrolase
MAVGETDCMICVKHREADRGLEIHRDGRVYVGHLPATPEAYLGYLFVEPLVHLAGLADLDDEAAAAFGRAVRDAGRALMMAGAEHVYAFVLGHHVPHLHMHVIGRHRGAPREYWGTRVDEWPEAPRGDRDAVARYVDRLRSGWPAARTAPRGATPS